MAATVPLGLPTRSAVSRSKGCRATHRLISSGARHARLRWKLCNRASECGVTGSAVDHACIARFRLQAAASAAGRPRRRTALPVPGRVSLRLKQGSKGSGRSFQAGLLESVDHPVAGLCAGVLATVLVQSSSVSTATIVGLVGAGTLNVESAVPMILGANIGTTITNTLASLASIGRSGEFRRAFAAAIQHDFFNILAVLIFLPLQIATGFLSDAAYWLADLLGGNVAGGKTRSPIKEVVKRARPPGPGLAWRRHRQRPGSGGLCCSRWGWC